MAVLYSRNKTVRAAPNGALLHHSVHADCRFKRPLLKLYLQASLVLNRFCSRTLKYSMLATSVSGQFKRKRSALLERVVHSWAMVIRHGTSHQDGVRTRPRGRDFAHSFWRVRHIGSACTAEACYSRRGRVQRSNFQPLLSQ